MPQNAEDAYREASSIQAIKKQTTRPPTLEELFGSRESIGDRVIDFDFASVNPSDGTPGFHTGLAPAYGKLNKDSFQKMDDNVKILISSSMRCIAKVPKDQRNWSNIISALKQNPLLKWDDEINRVDDTLRKSGTDAFKDGGIDQGIVNEVVSWFTKLVADEDVMRSTKIDINVLGRLVGQTGVCVTSFETLFHGESHQRKTMVDIGVLRFPDIDRPWIQVYYIKLDAWADSERTLFVESHSSGIYGEYKSQKFRPDARAMSWLQAEVHTQAVEEGNNTFRD